MRNAVLVAFSLLFYAYWDPRLTPLLIGSICLNWIMAIGLSRLTGTPRGQRRLVMLGVGANLALLAWFKYADFVVGSIAYLGAFEHEAWNIVLPLGDQLLHVSADLLPGRCA